jgi:hypothetical protein
MQKAEGRAISKGRQAESSKWWAVGTKQKTESRKQKVVVGTGRVQSASPQLSFMLLKHLAF